MKMERMQLPALAPVSANERFRCFCRDRGLSYEAAAELFGVSVSLVQAWMTKAGSSRYRAMRKPYVRLLNIEQGLEARSPTGFRP